MNQEFQNRMVEHVFNIAEAEIQSATKIGRLRSCTAWVYNSENYFFLKSYNTIVAIIDKRTRACYDILRKVYGYTATSAQHISKFWHDYGNGQLYMWK